MHIVLLKSSSNPSEDPYVQALTKAGHVVDLIETMDFHYHESELMEYVQWRNTHSAIVFTSPRAVIAFGKAEFKGHPGDLCFVVGPATCEQAKKLGFSPKGEHCGDAEELSRYIIQDFGSGKLSKPVLFPAAKMHRDILPKRLTASGIAINVVVAYSSNEHADLKERLRLHLCERNPIPDCIVFFSPSGVEYTNTILKSEIQPHRPTIKMIAMGHATAGAIKDLDLDVAAIATSPRPESLVNAVNKIRV